MSFLIIRRVDFQEAYIFPQFLSLGTVCHAAFLAFASRIINTLLFILTHGGNTIITTSIACWWQSILPYR